MTKFLAAVLVGLALAATAAIPADAADSADNGIHFGVRW